jgi:hypothetical protein
MNSSKLRCRIGCWAHERLRTEFVLLTPQLAARFGLGWVDLCNRHERVEVDSLTGGRRCLWEDSSRLTVARNFPRVGGRLLARCLDEWPIEFVDQAQHSPRATPTVADSPAVSIVLGVRGTGRLPQFRCCLASLLAQSEAACEIVVVEQSVRSEFETVIPPSVRYLHQQATDRDMPYNRGWALNAGVRAARGEIVVLHDADMIVPQRFAAAIHERMSRGLDALRLPRFIFYLDEPTSRLIAEERRMPARLAVDQIVANNPTPIALTRDAYLRIGGHDEAFYGWGAEDNEFLDRARTLRIGEGAFLPIVHLWHPVAPNRVGDRNAGQLWQLRSRSPDARIAQLVNRDPGRAVPSVIWSGDTPSPAQGERSISNSTQKPAGVS